MLTLEKPALTSENAGTIARAVLTNGGLMPWAVLTLWDDFSTMHKRGMLTAPWCGKTISIEELLGKNVARYIQILTSNPHQVTSVTAEKISAYYPNTNIIGVFTNYREGQTTPLAALFEAHIRSLPTYNLCFALAVICYCDEKKTEAATAFFAFIACVAKGGNATDAWIKKRSANFKKNSAFANMIAPTTDEMQLFTAHYLPNTVLPLQYCEILRQYYKTFREDEFPEGCWMIEQAPGMNCSALHAIAEVVGERTLSYELIRQCLAYEIMLTPICKAMWSVMHNPFINIKEPSVSLRRHATVAYVCVRLCYGTQYVTTTLGNMCKKREAVDALVSKALK